MSEQEVSPRRQQLLANIAEIIEALYRVPGVIGMDIQLPQGDDMWEKKVFVQFAGCDEPVGLELF